MLWQVCKYSVRNNTVRVVNKYDLNFEEAESGVMYKDAGLNT